jgi:hypothetical protein
MRRPSPSPAELAAGADADPAAADRRATLAYRVAIGAILAALAGVTLWNAHEYPTYGGYDVQQHSLYAQEVIEHWRLPEDAGRTAYYKPPAFYVVAGALWKAGKGFDLLEPHKPTQYLNALLVLATALLVLALARLLWPERRVVHVAALAFFALIPPVTRTAAWVHPGTAGLFLSTVGVYLCARMLGERRWGWKRGLVLAATLIGGLLVMSSNLWTYGVVLLVLAVAAIVRPAERAGILRTGGAVVLITALLAAPWYVRQAVRYGNPILGDRPTSSAPLWDRRPGEFYTGVGWPDVFTHPYTPSYLNELLPTTYTELWGDYFGVFAWGANTPPTDAVERDLTQQSELGLLPTALAFVGLGGIAWGLRRRRALAEWTGRLLVVGLPLAALAGYLLYVVSYPTIDGDVLKATFMLPAAPCWALAFAWAVERSVRVRFLRPALAVALVGTALLDLRFVVFHSPLGGLL